MDIRSFVIAMPYHTLFTFLSVVATCSVNILAGLEQTLKQGMAEEARTIRHESSEGHKTTRKDFAAKIDALSQKMDAKIEQLNDAITTVLAAVVDARKAAKN